MELGLIHDASEPEEEPDSDSEEGEEEVAAETGEPEPGVKEPEPEPEEPEPEPEGGSMSSETGVWGEESLREHRTATGVLVRTATPPVGAARGARYGLR